MVKAPLGTNPLAVLIVVAVGWVVIRLAGGLLRQAGIDLGESTVFAGSEGGSDGAHGHGGDGDGGGHGGDGGDAGGDRGGESFGISRHATPPRRT